MESENLENSYRRRFLCLLIGYGKFIIHLKCKVLLGFLCFSSGDIHCFNNTLCAAKTLVFFCVFWPIQKPTMDSV